MPKIQRQATLKEGGREKAQRTMAPLPWTRIAFGRVYLAETLEFASSAIKIQRQAKLKEGGREKAPCGPFAMDIGTLALRYHSGGVYLWSDIAAV